MRVAGKYFRAHDPQWAWAPDSGDGAREHGGRFNPVGTKALYLADSVDGMLAEMGHGLDSLFEPLTICSYDVDMEDIVDLTTDRIRKSWNISIEEMGCPWEMEIANGRTPASWLIAVRLIGSGAAGIRVPSFANNARSSMSNLVLWNWGRAIPHKVLVHDPHEKLPKDQTSWRH